MLWGLVNNVLSGCRRRRPMLHDGVVSAALHPGIDVSISAGVGAGCARPLARHGLPVHIQATAGCDTEPVDGHLGERQPCDEVHRVPDRARARPALLRACGSRRGPLPRAVHRHIKAIATGAAVPGDRIVPVEPRRPPGWPTARAGGRAAPAVADRLADALATGRRGGGHGAAGIRCDRGLTVRPSASKPGVLLADMPPSAAGAPAASAPPTASPESTPEPSSAPATPEPSTSPASTPSATGTTGAAKTKAPTGEGAPPRVASALPPVKHVFLIVLSEHSYSEAFGAGSPASYLTKTLLPQGELLSHYYAVTQGALANEIALISGQGPTPQTAEDCPTFAAIGQHTAGSEEQRRRQRLRVSRADADRRGAAERRGQDLEGLRGRRRRRRARPAGDLPAPRAWGRRPQPRGQRR